MSSRAFVRHGLCAQPGAPTNEFFFESATREEAKAFCQSCPVKEECLEFAIAVVDVEYNDQIVSRLGVYGGHDGNERAAIRRARLALEKEQNG